MLWLGSHERNKMAFIHIEHVPESIKVNLSLNLIIPEPGEMKGIPLAERRVLYLLHGLSDDASAWARFSRIEIHARKYGLVVVMPSAGRSFYTDMSNGQKYFTYLVEELPRYLEEVFGIKPAREKTLIAGLSMGGYGAMKAALLHPERYCTAGSFSGLLSLSILNLAQVGDPRRLEFNQLFGNLADLAGSVHDPMAWLSRAAQDPAGIPNLYVSCGRQDDLYPLNLMFRDSCKKLKVPLHFHETAGGHQWSLWDREIASFLVFAHRSNVFEVKK